MFESQNSYHYPPELFSLIVDTIPKLCKSKADVLTFFRGAGVDYQVYSDISKQLKFDRSSIGKYEITRTILKRINDDRDKYLRERREIVKRICEFEDFTRCWPNDLMLAKGLVSEIQKVVNIKDSFTRMKIEKEEERKKIIKESKDKADLQELRTKEFNSIKDELFALFSMNNPQKRGKLLEGILNRLFKLDGILIREAFTISGNDSEGIVEQIDGVVEINSHKYLVEMKWTNSPIGKDEISSHLVNVYHRGQARGIFISASDYTEPAKTICRESLLRTVNVLCILEEFVFLLEKQNDMLEFFNRKIDAADIGKNPYLIIK
ncbi:MAG: restriction endonuclease [FCB group bacterium]|nr:restriction endonuclease [FCB group bacterium]